MAKALGMQRMLRHLLHDLSMLPSLVSYKRDLSYRVSVH